MKVLIVLVALVASAAAFSTCGQKGSDGRIVNGLPAGHGEFPWQISLQYTPFFLIPKSVIERWARLTQVTLTASDKWSVVSGSLIA